MSLQGAFLRDDERSWAGSNLFFMCINRLDLNDKIYHIPPGVLVSNEDLTYYVDHLIAQLKDTNRTTQEEIEAYNYVAKVATLLKEWAKGGHGVKVVG